VETAVFKRDVLARPCSCQLDVKRWAKLVKDVPALDERALMPNMVKMVTIGLQSKVSSIAKA
jgi:hypothetical protein